MKKIVRYLIVNVKRCIDLAEIVRYVRPALQRGPIRLDPRMTRVENKLRNVGLLAKTEWQPWTRP